jgi:hypothetical protein
VQRLKIQIIAEELQHKTLLPFTKEKVIVAKEKLCCKNAHSWAPFPVLRTLYHRRRNNASVF